MQVKSEGPQARDTKRWRLPVMVTADWRIQVALLIILHIWLSKVIREERSCWGLMFKGALSVWEIIFGHPIFLLFFLDFRSLNIARDSSNQQDEQYDKRLSKSVTSSFLPLGWCKTSQSELEHHLSFSHLPRFTQFYFCCFNHGQSSKTRCE